MASERLKQILDIVKSNSEESIDDLLDLMQPEGKSRYEMGETFEETLGYNPISYYDEQQLRKIADEIADDPTTAPEVTEYIKDGDHKESLVSRAYEIFESERDTTFLPAAMEEAIEEETGISVSIEVEEDDDEDSELDDNESEGDFDEFDEE